MSVWLIRPYFIDSITGTLSLFIKWSLQNHIKQILDSSVSNLVPLWNCNFRAHCLFFLKCTLGISYSNHKSVEFMHSCNTVYGLMVHCFKNSRCEIMINIMSVFCLIYWSREGSGACLPIPYSTFNVLVRTPDKGWLMSSSLLLKIRVALQSGDRKHTINLHKMSSQIITHQK